tara:strand:- start:319 stop:582 length:264 start_codon:yes stop_codon:yes gene_type:complete
VGVVEVVVILVMLELKQVVQVEEALVVKQLELVVIHLLQVHPKEMMEEIRLEEADTLAEAVEVHHQLVQTQVQMIMEPQEQMVEMEQ